VYLVYEMHIKLKKKYEKQKYVMYVIQKKSNI